MVSRCVGDMEAKLAAWGDVRPSHTQRCAHLAVTTMLVDMWAHDEERLVH